MSFLSVKEVQKGTFIQNMSRLEDMRTQLLFGLKEWMVKGGPKSQEILKSSNANEELRYIFEKEVLKTFTCLVPKIMVKNNMNEIIAVQQNIPALKILITERADKKLIFTANGIILAQKYVLNLLMN